MILKGIIKKGKYFDSVTLMTMAEKLTNLDGVIDSAIVMGTKENLSILKTSGLLLEEFNEAKDSDLLIAIKTQDNSSMNRALNFVEELLMNKKTTDSTSSEYFPKSIENAVQLLEGANLALISVSGKYAYNEAYKALESNLHVMLFSDNVPIDKEIKLKNIAKEKGLLVMGPDCGTAIINGVPLAFANVVKRGDIGIVAASGTGLQEVSSIISNNSSGISQAIGTGGRDVKKEVGGIMFLEGIKALAEDKNTKIILLVSKPPAKEVLEKIINEAKNIKKPIVSIFLGGESSLFKNTNIKATQTLEEAALLATALSKGENEEIFLNKLKERKEKILQLAKEESSNKTKIQKYIRGLYSGGTLCDETQLLLRKSFKNIYSNTPIDKEYKLKDSFKSYQHTIIDLGEDEFTVGRPHPMIDFSLRKKKILEEAQLDETAIILFDVVLGYGSHMNPETELVPTIKKAIEERDISKGKVTYICSITGTEFDPQNKNKITKELQNIGVIVMPSNAAAATLAAQIIKQMEVR